MKIPVPTGSVQARALPTPYASTDTQGAFGAAYAGAIDKIDTAVTTVRKEKKIYDDRVAAEEARIREEQERKRRERREGQERAEAINRANADADYQRSETEAMVGGSNRRSLIDQAFEGPDDSVAPTAGDVRSEPGFLATRGMEAAEKSAEVVKRQEKRTQEIARARFADPASRERWLATRANGMLADTERRVEQHSAQQFRVAQQDALQGVKASALEGVVNAEDAETAAKFTMNAEERIRELADSPEGATAEVAKFRQDVLGVRIVRLLSDGDVEMAEGQFEAAKSHLGTAAPKLKAAIEQAKSARARNASDIEAERQAVAMVESATLPTGKLDAEKAAGLVDDVPPGPLRDEIRQRLEHRIQVKAKQWNQRVSKVYDGAFSRYLKTNSLGAIDPKAKSWLIENAPEDWSKLKDKAREDAAYWLRLQQGQPGETAEQRRALIAFKADLVERGDYYRGLSDEEFFREAAVQGLSPPGLSTAGTLWASNKKEDPVKVGEFGRFVEDEIRGNRPSMSKGDRDLFRSKMGDLRREYVAEHKAEPDAAARTEIRAEAWKLVAVPGRFFGTNEVPAFKAPRPKPAPAMVFEDGIDLTDTKQIVGWRVSPDKKSRAPKYADGTIGPIEAVP